MKSMKSQALGPAPKATDVSQEKFIFLRVESDGAVVESQPPQRSPVDAEALIFGKCSLRTTHVISAIGFTPSLCYCGSANRRPPVNYQWSSMWRVRKRGRKRSLLSPARLPRRELQLMSFEWIRRRSVCLSVCDSVGVSVDKTVESLSFRRFELL